MLKKILSNNLLMLVILVGLAGLSFVLISLKNEITDLVSYSLIGLLIVLMLFHQIYFLYQRLFKKEKINLIFEIFAPIDPKTVNSPYYQGLMIGLAIFVILALLFTLLVYIIGFSQIY